jgi:hypothetical protein
MTGARRRRHNCISISTTDYKEFVQGGFRQLHDQPKKSADELVGRAQSV